MATFSELDVSVSRTAQNSSTSINGIEVASKDSTLLELTLPRTCPITASFCKEGISRKLIKLFKKELQTGDSTFDDAVYISTDTTDATAAWLANAAVRADILELIESGATIEVSGATVTAELPSQDEREDPALVRVVASLLA